MAAKKKKATPKPAKKAAPRKPANRSAPKTTPKSPAMKGKAKAPAKAPKAKVQKKALPPVDVVKKPKKPAKANPPPAVPHKKTIFEPVKTEPPKPKATISREKAIGLANAFLKENVGKAALYAPRTSRFRLGSIVDKGGIINVCFCHEADDFDPAITSLATKCLDALIAAHPQLRAFNIEVQTIRM